MTSESSSPNFTSPVNVKAPFGVSQVRLHLDQLAEGLSLPPGVVLPRFTNKDVSANTKALVVFARSEASAELAKHPRNKPVIRSVVWDDSYYAAAAARRKRRREIYALRG